MELHRAPDVSGPKILIAGSPSGAENRPVTNWTLEGAMQTDAGLSSEVATLQSLNHEYIRAVQTSDVGWFENALAADFRCSLPDGSLIDRARFLERASHPADITALEAHDVDVRMFADIAIIHARTTFRSTDGRPGSGRYTDIWARQDGRWLVVAAHVTRKAD